MPCSREEEHSIRQFCTDSDQSFSNRFYRSCKFVWWIRSRNYEVWWMKQGLCRVFSAPVAGDMERMQSPSYAAIICGRELIPFSTLWSIYDISWAESLTLLHLVSITESHYRRSFPVQSCTAYTNQFWIIQTTKVINRLFERPEIKKVHATHQLILLSSSPSFAFLPQLLYILKNLNCKENSFGTGTQRKLRKFFRKLLSPLTRVNYSSCSGMRTLFPGSIWSLCPRRETE